MQNQTQKPNRRPLPQRRSQLAATAGDAKRLSQLAKYGKQLFNGSADYLSAAQIAIILKQCGFDIPHGVVVTAEMAQIIASGGAVISDIEQGENFASIASPTATTIRATAQLLQTIGVAKKMNKELCMIQIGADVALILGSCGANVGAWIDLALNVYKLGEMLSFKRIDAVAEHDAYQKVYDWYNNRETKQRMFVVDAFQDYQNGKTTTWDYIDEVAKNSPDLFLKVFPQLVKDIPQFKDYHAESSSASQYTFGVQQESDATVWLPYWTTHYARKEVQQAIFNEFINPALNSYGAMINSFPKNLNFRDLAIICQLPPFVQFLDPETDFANFMSLLNLTPHDLGSDVIYQGLKTGKMFTPKKPLQPAITYNGVEYATPTQNAQILRDSVSKADAYNILKSDFVGDAQTLFSYWPAYDYVNDWARMPFTPAELNAKADASGASYALGRGYQIGVRSENVMRVYDTEQVLNQMELWRYPNQFVIALKTIAEMKKSNIFSDWQYQPSELYNFFGLVDDYEKRHRDLSMLVTARSANLLARDTIAFVLGTSSENIEPARPIKTGRPTIWRVKK